MRSLGDGPPLVLTFLALSPKAAAPLFPDLGKGGDIKCFLREILELATRGAAGKKNPRVHGLRRPRFENRPSTSLRAGYAWGSGCFAVNENQFQKQQGWASPQLSSGAEARFLVRLDWHGLKRLRKKASCRVLLRSAAGIFVPLAGYFACRSGLRERF